MSAPAVVVQEKITDWRERLALTTATMRAMSRQTDPQEMRRIYLDRMRQLRPLDGSVSLSRRGLKAPWVRITRSTRWAEDLNPWKEQHRLPLLSGGLLAELIYGDEPRLIDDLHIPADDPAAEYLEGFRSVAVIPLYDQGEALNMALLMQHEPGAFNPEDLPELVSMSNLFGRATHNLVLMEQLKEAYEAADYELKVVADIQRSLLPRKPPKIPTMAVAAYYHTAHRAGGDYYDFFPFPDGTWGILVADVSGHGTPAAVLMAVTHSLAHTYQGPPTPPGDLLNHVNDHLTRLYTAESDTFVTAFYGVYNPADRTLTYASAGHNPPRLKRCDDGTLAALDGARGLPLGISPAERYHEQRHTLVPGDQLVLYTDGITEAEGPSGELFGTERLDKVLENCSVTATDLLQAVLDAVQEFTAGRPAADDRTLLVAKIS
ncbi:MAG TPA: stage II sporulation protein E [Planctomycetales bacterium]|jgi:sigma-B regulation protein RsbU (phosphoserine phosphatase)|nr:stage II sporulation protein E [Planctomycetales bacterium]